MSIIRYGQFGLTYGAGFTYGQSVGDPSGSKKMKQAALKLDEKNLDQVLDLCVLIEEGLKNKPVFAGVTPTPANLKTKRDAIAAQRGLLAAAEAAVAGIVNTIAGLETDLRNSLTLTATNAVTAVAGDEVQLTAANIPLRKAGTPASDAPAPPENPHGSYGDLAGEVDWQWNGVRGRMLFIAETATSANGPFTHAYAGTKSKFTSTGHPSGSEVFMRVKCNCNGFDSNWSQVVSHRAH